MNGGDASRRRFLLRAGNAFALAAATRALPALAAPALITADRARPAMPCGPQFGDVGTHGATVWARSDRMARMVVEVADGPGFRNARLLRGPLALPGTDFTARLDLPRPRGDEPRFVRVAFEAPEGGARGEWIAGSFRAAPAAGDAQRPVRLVWGGDVAGQGWGIDEGFGGMRIFDAMRARDPDFFIHSGDTIYADNEIRAEVVDHDGATWRNLVADGVHKVAETLDEFRGRYRYNLRDAPLRRFAAQVPQVWQWDDHEVMNNWSPGKDLRGDPRYAEKDIAVLAARARRAFLEYSPQRLRGDPARARIDRVLHYGPLLDVFVLDMRGYRAANGDNLQRSEGADTAFLGARQLRALAHGLRASKALWKIVAADMPLALQISDKDASGRRRWEAVANGDAGPPLGRELEFARLLRAIRGVRNVAWLTADVHYCAAHHYDPARAAFQGFAPFWEFVAGPLNAGGFGAVPLDMTFGPEVVFQRAPPMQNASPRTGYQFFGEASIDPDARTLTVDLRDIDGRSVHTQVLQPA